MSATCRNSRQAYAVDIMQVKTTGRQRKGDARGFLLEFVRGDEIKGMAGQVYCTVSEPGAVRGNHYHKRKTEWFTVLEGEAILKLKDLATGEEKELLLSGEKPGIVEIPAGIAHALKNSGKDKLYHVAYISEPFKEQDQDTYPLKLL